jgi:hypothetical protein
MGDSTKAYAAFARRGSLRAWTAGALLGCFALSAQADHLIGAGGTVSLGNGTISLGCTDLIVAGTLDFQQGTYLAVRNVAVLPGGVVNGGTGSLTYSGTISIDPAGQFNQQQLVLVHSAGACGAVVAAEPAIVPALSNFVLFALAGLLLGLAYWRLRNATALRRG